jgi:hypothetical protein
MFSVLTAYMSVIKTAGPVGDRMSYIIIRRRWCDIVVMNVHGPTENKINDVDSFYEEIQRVFDKFLKYYKKILFGDINVKVGKENIF